MDAPGAVLAGLSARSVILVAWWVLRNACEAKEARITVSVTDLDHSPRTAQQVLSDCRATVVPALRAAVDTLPAPLRRAAGYHLGWCDEHGRPSDFGGGKMLRPALVLLSAEAVGGCASDAVPAAVAVELTHNFSLLHDDVMDRDGTRHNRRAVWAAFGVPTAVLAGDALWSLALQVLGDCGGPAGEAMRTLSAALHGLVTGQSADLDFEHRDQVSVEECVAMAVGKTGALLGGGCALGVLFGGGEANQGDRLRGFGERLGLAFQLVDDLLGIWGDPVATGKPAGSDLQNRKKSLPAVAALASGTPAGAELAALYRLDRPLTRAELDRAAWLVEAAGGRAWAQEEADRHIAAALACLHAADPPPRVAAELGALASLIVRRHR
jgi:geranylgeranyl diphosphate synthase, type I